ncbi:hypothetical protein NXC14_PA00413 (plasmid) [Rhizobium sp. NXC14]|uniref:hypothetical protein n=1 Tax=Rhizobium sp. NXC14 TaxID=1981173 RepID=UPI000A203F4F|nr:hypothetical protein [Rhizobium sp. NXC14]ARO32678.1 hypothetical protein NXC14_PA00413 [Rhizobium sp. NXC14]
MYMLKPGIKKDPVRRWALPDRIFFGNGACAILAGVFLKEAPLPEFYAERIIPGEGFAGNHIFVTDGVVAFDHHGYSLRNRLLAYHTNGWASRSAEGWNCRLERVTFDLLDRRDLNDNKMLGPDQYLHDPIARAETYLGRVNHIEASERARAKQLVHSAI